MKKKLIVCLLTSVAMVGMFASSGAMAEKTWWRKKLIEADKNLGKSSVGKEYVSNTYMTEEEKHAMYMRQAWANMTDEEKNSRYFSDIQTARANELAKADEEKKLKAQEEKQKSIEDRQKQLKEEKKTREDRQKQREEE